MEKCQSFSNIPICISLYITPKSSCGVISEADLIYVSEGEILENLGEQSAHSINIQKDGRIIPTKHIAYIADCNPDI